MKLTTFAIAYHDWNTQVFSVVIQQAKDSARKIMKGIDVGIERKRFNNACNRIENLALQKGKVISIEENNFQGIIDNLLMKSNALLPFIEHDNVKELTKYFDHNCIKYLTDNRSSLVFLLNEYSKGHIILNTSGDEALVKNYVKSNINELNDVESLNLNDIQSRFHRQILTAIEKGTPIGWINLAEGEDNTQTLMRHEGIISCLREHIFASKQPTAIEKYTVKEKIVDIEANEIRSKSFWFKILNFFFTQPYIMKQINVPKTRIVNLDIIPRYVQFAFSDGSISESFPLYSMIEIKPKDNLQSIKVSLISNRHFELDSIVETCILRNSELSRRQEATIADQEKLSFEVAYRFFTDILSKTNRIHVELFHTGLEPAVIGTYRALLTILLENENRGKIAVTPKVFKGRGKFDDLKQWY